MNKIDTLKMSIFKDEWFALENKWFSVDDDWFVLENKDMDQNVFSELVNSLSRVFIEEYGVKVAKEHVAKETINDELVLFINAKKVPNIVKSLVQMPNYDIQIELRGRTNTGEEKGKLMAKPFDANSCAEVIPYYNKNSKRTQ